MGALFVLRFMYYELRKTYIVIQFLFLPLIV